MKKYSFFLFLAFASITANANDSIPSLEILFSSIDSFYNQKLESELKAFETNPKDYWMNFVPSVGIAYTPSGAPRPSFSFSLNSLFNYRNQKRQVASVRESIKLKNSIERQQIKLQVSSIFKKIELLQEDFIFETQIFEIDSQLFEFYKKQNENNDIKPSEFLIKKKDFLNKQQNLRLSKREISILVIELYESSFLQSQF